MLCKILEVLFGLFDSADHLPYPRGLRLVVNHLISLELAILMNELEIARSPHLLRLELRQQAHQVQTVKPLANRHLRSLLLVRVVRNQGLGIFDDVVG